MNKYSFVVVLFFTHLAAANPCDPRGTWRFEHSSPDPCARENDRSFVDGFVVTAVSGGYRSKCDLDSRETFRVVDPEQCIVERVGTLGNETLKLMLKLGPDGKISGRGTYTAPDCTSGFEIDGRHYAGSPPVSHVISAAGIDPQKAEREIRSRAFAVTTCYEAELKRNPELVGALTVRMSGTAGKVQVVDLVEDAVHADPVIECVKARLVGWRFAGAKAFTIDYRFELDRFAPPSVPTGGLRASGPGERR
jgi:hypothetical protein